MSWGATVPVDRRQILVRIDHDSRCVRCGARLFKVYSLKHPEPEVVVDRNALGEFIAWCACRSCGKISPLTIPCP